MKTKELKESGQTQETQEPRKEFKGYTIEEIRYQRALVALRKEFCKGKILKSVDEIRHPRRAKAAEKSGIARWTGMAGNLLSNVNIVDCVVFGMSLVGPGRKFYRLLKGFRKLK